jgi:membrane protein
VVSRRQRAKRDAGRGVTDVLAGSAVVIGAIVGAIRSPSNGHVTTAEPEPAPPPPPAGLVGRIDAWQRRVPAVAFPVAVAKKFSDDRAGRLAALVAYYGFFSIFPLLLVAVTIIGYALGDESAAQIKSSAIGQIPIVGDQIGAQVGPLHGSVIALVIGSVTALWAGLACMQAAQDAMNEIWGVPRPQQPSFLVKRLRSVGVLAVIGTSLLAGAAVSAVLGAIPALAGPGRIVAVAASVVVNIAVYLLAFQILTTSHQRWRELLPGAVVGGIAYSGLQFAGQWYVARTINGAQNTYGTFAVVIGLLGWLYLLGQVSIYAAEINVVRARRLWPRSIVVPPTPADREVAREVARTAQLRPDTEIVVRFPADDERPAAPPHPSTERHAS